MIRRSGAHGVVSAGVGEIVENAERAQPGLAAMVSEPLFHAVVVGDDVVGTVQSPDFLFHGESLAAKTAQVVYLYDGFRSVPMGHTAHEGEIFLQGILQHQDVALAQAEAGDEHPKQGEEEMRKRAVTSGAWQRGMPDAHALHDAFDVGFGLVACAAKSFVVS